MLRLLFPSEEAARHWTVRRLLAQAGLEPGVYDISIVGPSWDRHLPTSDALVAFGPDVFWRVYQSGELMRWFARIVPTQWGPMIPLLLPKDLLPQRGSGGLDDEADAAPAFKTKRYHRMSRLAGAQAMGLRRAARVARGESPAPPPESAELLDPSPAAFADWADTVLSANPPFLSFDIETDYHLRQKDKEDQELKVEDQITRISFWCPYMGTTVPCLPQYEGTIRRLLESDLAKVGWNSWGFDDPVLHYHKYRIGGVHYDAQIAWKVLQSDLPMSIEWVSGIFHPYRRPWKHLADQEGAAAQYCLIDSEEAGLLFLDIKARLESEGRWEHYVNQYVKLRPVTNRAGRQGSRINEDLRLELKEEFSAELAKLFLHIQETLPPNFQPRKLYTRLPKNAGLEWREVQTSVKGRRCSACGRPNVNKNHACKVLPDGGWEIEPFFEPGVKYVQDPQRDWTYEQVHGWLRKGNGFNPNSSDQVIKYALAHGHKIGINPKTRQPTADKRTLDRLIVKHQAQHPVYAQTKKAHLIGKALSSYVNRFVPDEKELVYTVYGDTPSTGRMSGDLQQIGRRASNEYAQRARRMFVPRPGHRFVEADFASLEPTLVGYYMNSPEYIELARKGAHAYLAAYYLGLVRSPADFTTELAAEIKTKHKALYAVVKNSSNAINYLGSAYMLHMTYPEEFPTLARAEDIHRAVYRAVPTLGPWQDRVLNQAHKENYLQSEWGGRHYFYWVQTLEYDDAGNLLLDKWGRPKKKRGIDGARAAAFFAQHAGGMIIRDTIVLLGDSKWAPYMPAHVAVHDSICLDVPDALAAAAADFLVELMTRPIPQLGGLRIGVEVDVSDLAEEGGNWLDLKPYKKVTLLDEERMAA